MPTKEEMQQSYCLSSKSKVFRDAIRNCENVADSNVNVMILATAILNTISDFSLLILPIFSVWRLHMRNTQKLGISAIFAAGLL